MAPTEILRLEVRGFLFGLAAVLALKMMTRRVVLDGLLQRKDDAGDASPERVQLLLATLAMSVEYLGSVVHNTSGTMPDVSPKWLYLFGGSTALYASVKAFRTLGKK